jgi:hypothetical protein
MLLFCHGYCQEPGIEAGVSLCNQTWKNTEGNDIHYQPIAGYHVGLNIEFSLKEKLSLQTALVAENKGYHFVNQGVYYKNTIVYASWPIVLKYKFANERWFITLGGYTGMALTALEITHFEGSTDIFRLSLGNDEITDDFRKFDYGLLLSAGICLGKFSISLGASQGLANIYPSGNKTIRNRSLGILIGYGF